MKDGDRVVAVRIGRRGGVIDSFEGKIVKGPKYVTRRGKTYGPYFRVECLKCKSLHKTWFAENSLRLAT